MAKPTKHIPSDLIDVILGKLESKDRYKLIRFNHRCFKNFPKDERMLLLHLELFDIDLTTVKMNSVDPHILLRCFYLGLMTNAEIPVRHDIHRLITETAIIARTSLYDPDDETIDDLTTLNIIYAAGIAEVLFMLIMKLESQRLFKSLIRILPLVSQYYVKMSREMSQCYVDNIRPDRSVCWSWGLCPPNLIDYPDLASIYIDKISKAEQIRHMDLDQHYSIIKHWMKQYSLRELWERKVVYHRKGFEALEYNINQGYSMIEDMNSIDTF